MQLWKVIGGVATNGIIVRAGYGLASDCNDLRLATGSLIHEVEIRGDRLKYELVSGSGPPSGWVSIRLKNRDLLVKQSNMKMLTKRTIDIDRNSKAADDRHVTIIGIAGEEVASLALPSRATVLMIKEELASICAVPPERQHLLKMDNAGAVGKGGAPLRDNVRVDQLLAPLTLQLVRLTERKGVLYLYIRGMWSFAGTHTKVTAFAETTWLEVKQMIERDIGVDADRFDLQLPDGRDCDDDLRLEKSFSASNFHHEIPMSVFLFARAHPDRRELLEMLKKGEISAQEVAAIDPDCLMPAC